MVRFETLRIDDNNNLVVVAHVKEESYYKNVYIDQIIIDSPMTFTETGPSDKPIFTKTYTKPVKIVDTTITNAEIAGSKCDFGNGPFFVYIHTTGAPSATIPCGMDNEITLGVAINLCAIYRKGIHYVKELAKTCSIPDGFVNFILSYNALKLAIVTKDFPLVRKIWMSIFHRGFTFNKRRSCGCGRF